MNISLKPNPILAIWLPGFALTMFAIFFWHNGDKIGLLGDFQLMASISFWTVVVIITIAFIIGQLLDAARDIILENFVFEKLCGKLKWNFFFEADPALLEKVDEWYYLWYEMDANLVVAILIASILALVGKLSIDFFTWIAMAVALILFFCDARELRIEIKNLIDKYYKENK